MMRLIASHLHQALMLNSIKVQMTKDLHILLLTNNSLWLLKALIHGLFSAFRLLKFDKILKTTKIMLLRSF